MAADTQDALSKIDSVTEEASVPKKRRPSSQASDCYSLEEAVAMLDKENETLPEDKKKKLEIDPKTRELGWKVNTSPGTIEDKDVLKLPLCIPKLKSLELALPYSGKIVARNLKGITVRDALDAIYKYYKKQSDDELRQPYFKGFEWNVEVYKKEISAQNDPIIDSKNPPPKPLKGFTVHLIETSTAPATGSSKKKNKKKDTEE